MNRQTNKFHTNLRHPEKKELDIMKLTDKIKDEMYRQKYTVYMLHKALGEAGHTISRDSLYRWDMIGELEHLINPVHGIFSDFKSTHDYDKKTWKELIDQADKAGEMLAAHLDKFHAIMQLTDTISQSEQKS